MYFAHFIPIGCGVEAWRNPPKTNPFTNLFLMSTLGIFLTYTLRAQHLIIRSSQLSLKLCTRLYQQCTILSLTGVADISVGLPLAQADKRDRVLQLSVTIHKNKDCTHKLGVVHSYLTFSLRHVFPLSHDNLFAERCWVIILVVIWTKELGRFICLFIC